MNIELGAKIDEFLEPDRIAVRCVAFKEGKLVLVQTSQGDMKFPGGGVNIGESYEIALEREIAEETGYELISINKKLGEAKETRLLLDGSGKKMFMKSIYFYCDVDFNVKGKQDLDEYEKDLGFEVVFATIQEALENNEKVLHGDKENINIWVEREVLALKELKNMNLI